MLLAFVTANPEEIGKPLGDFARVSTRPYRTEELLALQHRWRRDDRGTGGTAACAVAVGAHVMARRLRENRQG